MENYLVQERLPSHSYSDIITPTNVPSKYLHVYPTTRQGSGRLGRVIKTLWTNKFTLLSQSSPTQGQLLSRGWSKHCKGLSSYRGTRFRLKPRFCCARNCRSYYCINYTVLLVNQTSRELQNVWKSKLWGKNWAVVVRRVKLFLQNKTKRANWSPADDFAYVAR